MSELNGDELRRRSDGGGILTAHEALHERLYWALQYWGADGQEGDDAAREMIQAFVAERHGSLIQQLLDRAVCAYRLHDSLLNDPDNSHARSISVGEMSAFCDALCILQGWDLKEHGDKEGRADEMIVAHWRKKFPEEWT